MNELLQTFLTDLSIVIEEQLTRADILNKIGQSQAALSISSSALTISMLHTALSQTLSRTSPVPPPENKATTTT